MANIDTKRGHVYAFWGGWKRVVVDVHENVSSVPFVVATRMDICYSHVKEKARKKMK